MKPKKSFPGLLCQLASDLWKDYKLILAFLAAAIGLLIASITTYGQGKTTGQQVPAGTITCVVNYTQDHLQLTDFHDKLLILDFWATYCGPCRELIPQYDSLQKTFGNRLQILLVTHEKGNIAARFLAQHHYSLPSITADTRLAQAFPHNSIPYEVWIYKGRVVATTAGEEVTEMRIRQILEEGSSAATRIPQKMMAPFDEDQPLLINGNGQLKEDSNSSAAILSQSLFTPYNPGLNSIAGVHRTSQHINVFALNATPISLYHLAARQADPMLDVSNRFIVELTDSLRDRAGANFKGPVKRAWLERYALCYNLCLPANFKGELSAYLFQDLNRFLSSYAVIEAEIANRNVRCLLLTRIPGKPVATGSARVPEFLSDTTRTIVSGLPISQLVLQLAYTYRRLPTPLIDETGITGTVDLRLDGNIANREQLEKTLRDNGLQLIEASREIPMVVIRQAAQSNHSLPNLNAN